MRTILMALLLVGSISGASLVSAQAPPSSSYELRRMGREWATQRWDQSDPAPDNSPRTEKFRKIGEGFPSLLIPGWSQWRQGHKSRAAVFLAAEIGVWTSWAIFRVQGSRREDSYADYAVQFADVEGTDHDEAYWKAVAIYRNSEDYNEDLRRDERGGLDPEGSPYTGEQAWQWQSPQRLDEYQQLRASSLTSYDRAENVLALALITRAVAVADAIREAFLADGVGDDGNVGLHMRANPLRPEEGAELGLRLRF